MKRIRITAGKVSLEAEVRSTPTAQKLLAALPIDAQAQRWGQEIYFPIPVRAAVEPDAREEMQVGEIAYWPEGSCFCIFFGPTPASSGAQPVAASPVNVLGKVIGDALQFDTIRSGVKVTIEAVAAET
jgi:uncharacterized protein